MVHPVIYGMRGWIAFVAFIEFSNAIRCFTDEKNYIQGNLLLDNSSNNSSPIFGRLFGRFCLLNGIILTHCALCIDHIPIICLTIISLSISIAHYASEAFYYYTTSVNFYTIFPILISFSTIVCLVIAPVFLEEQSKKNRNEISSDSEDENDEEFDKVLYQKQTHHRKTPIIYPPAVSSKIKKVQ